MFLCYQKFTVQNVINMSSLGYRLQELSSQAKKIKIKNGIIPISRNRDPKHVNNLRPAYLK